MKRFVCLLLSLIFVASISLVGCVDYAYGEPCAEDKHSYGAYVYQNDATCFEDGTEVARCVNPYCPAKLVRSKAGTQLTHNPQLIAKCDPTCYSDGYTQDFYQCSHCKTYFSEQSATEQSILTSIEHLVIPKSEQYHIFEVGYTVDIPAGNRTEGLKSRHCIHYNKCYGRTDITAIPSRQDDDGWGKPK